MGTKKCPVIRVFAVIPIMGMILFSGCCKESGTGPEQKIDPAIPSTTIGVISDIHVFDTALGTGGTAFQDYLEQDRKLIVMSESILEAAVNNLISEGVEIVLVPGDLTKDGEKASHQMVAGYLRQLEDAGIEVYIVPGNHDIANPHAMSYVGDSAVPVESVTPAEFTQVYGDFGFDEALYSDENSLSYVAEPVEGLWIICMDCCRYDENTDHPVTGGSFSEETFAWIRSKLAEAAQLGKLVFGMMHHGIQEHFLGQKTFFPDYVLDNYTQTASTFSELGMKAVFTGHFHSQDIVMLTTTQGFIFDIETGSTVTYPCPYRIIEIDDNHTMTIVTKKITQIDYDTGALTFAEYAADYLETGMTGIVTYMLMTNYGMSSDDASDLAPLMTQAILAHYAGDETADTQTLAAIQQLQNDPDFLIKLVGQALQYIWTDPSPADNDIIIDLMTGQTYGNGSKVITLGNKNTM